MCVSLAAALDLQQVADESTAYFSRANGEREGGVGWGRGRSEGPGQSCGVGAVAGST